MPVVVREHPEHHAPRNCPDLYCGIATRHLQSSPRPCRGWRPAPPRRLPPLSPEGARLVAQGANPGALEPARDRAHGSHTPATATPTPVNAPPRLQRRKLTGAPPARGLQPPAHTPLPQKLTPAHGRREGVHEPREGRRPVLTPEFLPRTPAPPVHGCRRPVRGGEFLRQGVAHRRLDPAHERHGRQPHAPRRQFRRPA